MVKYPIVFEETLNEDEFDDLENQFDSPEWRLSDSFWHIPNLYLYRQSFKCKMLAQRSIQKELCENGWYVKGQTYGLEDSFHSDDCDFTFSLFSCGSWNKHWGGDLIIENKSRRNKWERYEYMPNRSVLFPAHWLHCSSAPNRYCHKLRTSVTFKFSLRG